MCVWVYVCVLSHLLSSGVTCKYMTLLWGYKILWGNFHFPTRLKPNSSPLRRESCSEQHFVFTPQDNMCNLCVFCVRCVKLCLSHTHHGIYIQPAGSDICNSLTFAVFWGNGRYDYGVIFLPHKTPLELTCLPHRTVQTVHVSMCVLMCVLVRVCVFLQKIGKVPIFVSAHIRRFSGIIC